MKKQTVILKDIMELKRHEASEGQIPIVDVRKERAVAFIPAQHPEAKRFCSLFEAAPNLLEALKNAMPILEYAQGKTGDWPEVVQCKEAIKKAIS